MARRRSGKRFAMAKKKSAQQQLVERLHVNGVRKRVAETIAGGRKGSEGAARDALSALRGAVDEVEDRLKGSPKKKRAAAGRKAAATRKRNATKRNTAAKKGAAKRTTRAKAK